MSAQLTGREWLDPEWMPPALTNHERVAMSLLDFGFVFPEFRDAYPDLAERGLITPLGTDRWHVTGNGRRAYRRR